MIQYVLECIAFQLVFLIIYDLFLKRETFFQWNRLYLIGTYIISMVLPWIKIEAMKTTVPQSFQAYPEFLWNTNAIAVTATAVQETSFTISWEYALLFGGMLMATLFFGYKLFQIYALKRKGEVHYFRDFTQIIIANSSIAFSFFKSIFLGDKVIAKEHQSIVQHELVHIRQRHSYDLMLFELMRIVGWFNPLVYVYQSRVSELHEFIADAKVAKSNKKEQYEFLLSQVFQTQNISFINQFFKTSLIKKRIVMLTKEKSKQVLKLKYLLLLPLVFGMLAYTSIERELHDDTESIIQTTEDAELIAKIETEIEKEIATIGSIEKVFFRSKRTLDNNMKSAYSMYKKSAHILTKKEYFKEQLLHKMFFENFKGVEFGDDVEPGPTFKMPLPSSKRYENYLRRINAFAILDDNLKYSIEAYDQDILLIDKLQNYSDDVFVFEVMNVKDLTGKELRNFNVRLSEIFESPGADYTSIVLVDNRYAFKVVSGNNADLQDHLRELNFPSNEIIVVEDIENLTKKEEKQVFRRLKNLSETSENWVLVIKDKNTSMKIVSANDDSYLSGPNGEKIGARLVYDSSLNEESKLSITEFLKKNGTTNFSVDKTDVSNDKSFEWKGLSDPVPFAKVDNVPVFPGCENADDKRACFLQSMQRHISKNFNYPKEAQEKGIQGRVNTIFVISKKGKIEGLRMRGPDSILEKEVKRIINRLPKMKPGEHRGKKVDVPFSIPVVFKLDIEKTFDKLPENSNRFGPKAAQAIKQYNQLVTERERLLKNSNEKNPIIVNLDEQLNNLRNSINKPISASSTIKKGGVQEQYASLLKERERLLKSTNEKNPVIVNLDAQLERLRKAISQDDETVPFATIDEVPIFPGCEDAENKRKCFNEKIQKHISKNFNYPKEAQEKGIRGRVSVMFTIATDGSIQNIRKRGPDSLLESEVERIIKRLPKMKPGKHKGKAVNVPFSIPITFKLQGDKNKTSLKPNSNGSNESAPLVIIDGKESTLLKLNSMSTDKIESMNVFKDEAATRKYGDKGKNGVIEVKTKEFDFGSPNLDIIKLDTNNGTDPIYFIDGKESSKEKLKAINPNDIESINVLKGESAEALYGEKGKNGAIQITTKKKE